MTTRENDSYFDIDFDVEEVLAKNGMVDAVFYLRDLKQRKLYLNDTIDQITVDDIVSHIIQYNRQDKGVDPKDRQTIMLYLSSNGGEVDAGFQLIDVILASKTPVYTINLGYQYSMGFLIGLAGHKRFATPNAKFLMHDGTNFVYNSGTKVQDQMAFQRRVEERIRRFVIDHSHVTPEEYDSKLRVEWYLFADEAKEKGFVDQIIGVDCPFDDIV